MNILVFDTETTGFPPRGEFDPDNPKNPQLVEIAAALYRFDDEAPKLQGGFSAIIKPDGYEIPEKAASIHGISTERAERYGVDIKLAVKMFNALAERAEMKVAHNIDFDLKIMQAAYARAGLEPDWPDSSYCTMAASTPLCRLPGRFDDYKWPKLQEAHVHFFGEEFDGAHSALADVEACARVFFALQASCEEAAE